MRLLRARGALPIALLVVVATHASATPVEQVACFRPTQGTPRWSNPSSWPSGAVPQAGACATIPQGMTMYLDVSTAPLAGLDVQGSLVFLCGDLTLTSDWIQVTGSLHAGSPGHPFHHTATIRLTDSFTCGSMEPQTLAVEGSGLLSLHGKARTPSWTRLAGTAAAGTSTLQLQVAPAWGAGQTIVVASTDYDRHQAEVRTIQSVSGAQVTLTQPLGYTHWGATEGQAYDGIGVPQHAEVAQFGRHVVVEGTPYVDDFGGTVAGHTILRNPGATPPTARLSWVEFRDLGKEGTLGRYPIHFHQIGDASASYVRDCSIHRSYNRAISIHTTQNLQVQDNFCYDVRGHAYYFEDDPATGCTLQRNLGLLTRIPAVLVPGVNSDRQPSTFWLHSPQNVVEDNVAAGAAGFGFWLETEDGDATPWTSFQRNVAHSNALSGFYQNTRPRPSPPSLYQDLVAYKNREYGFWLRSYGAARILRAGFADNRGAFYIASEGFQFDALEYVNRLLQGLPPIVDPLGISTITLEDSLVIGESDNFGTPATCEELAYGRSLPQAKPFCCGPSLPKWAALTGVELYDGLVGVEDTIFADFEDLSLPSPSCSSAALERKAAPLHQVRYDSPWAIDPRNYVSGVSFVNAPHPVHLRTPNGTMALSCGTVSDDGGIANTIVHDRDGSLTGVPGSSVFADGPLDDFLVPYSGATKDPAWNAYVTAGPPSTPFAQLDFYNLNKVLLEGTFADEVVFHAPARGESFAKPGPLLNGCGASGYRIPRHVTNVVSDDVYDIHYDPTVPQSDWARVFTLALQFTEPGRWVYVTVPLLPPDTGLSAMVNDAVASAASDPLALYNGPGNQYWYDPSAQRIHLKLAAGGTGSTIFDGTRSVFFVWSQ